MPSLNRRTFLVTGATALLSGGVALSWPELLRVAADRPLADETPVLVIVTLYGGNDGINTVIPYTDSAYHDARAELAYSPTEVLHLDDRLGLNPACTGLAQLWKDQHLAVIRGVGYPKPDHSHFRSMDIWQTASPSEPVATGWIGRWLDATGDDPLRAVNIGAVLPALAVGATHTAAALAPTTRAGKHPAPLTALMTALGAPDGADTAAMAAARAAYRAATTADAAFAALPAQICAPAAHGGTANPLAAQLDTVADCIKAGVPTRVYTVSLGGFDTHADEKVTQQRLLGVLDAAVAGFLRDMATDTRGRNVVLMAYSEFGRRTRANASQGTDHGTAGPVIVGGMPVRGGFYGEEPSLTDLDNGDIKATTDFRDIYHELLTQVLRTDPAPSVGAGRRALGFL